MSETHSSGGTGKMVVLTIFGLIVAVFLIKVIGGVKKPSGQDVAQDHSVAQVTHAPKVDAKELAQLKKERDEALAKIAELNEALNAATSRAQESDNRLGLVRNLLDAEAAISK